MMEKSSDGVLVVLNEYPTLGGVEKVSGQLTAYLMKHGYRVDILALRKGSGSSQVSPMHTLYYLPDKTDINSAENLSYTRALIQKNGYRSVINQGVVSTIYKDVPTINVLHACPQWIFERESSSCLKQAFLKQKTFRNLRRYLMATCFPAYHRHRIENRWRSEIEASAHYVVLTEAYQKEIRERLYGLTPEQCPSTICVIPNPVYPSTTTSSAEKIVLYAGRFTYADKRLDRLLRIWAKVESVCPDWQLHMVGEGPEKSNLQDLARRLSLKRVCFVDPIWDDRLYASASVYAMTSSFEGFPLSLMEAQQAGIVPIAYQSTASFTEIIDHGLNGLLVRPFDEKAYVDALTTLLQDDDKRARMSVAAKEKASTYRMEQIGEKWLELLKD